MNRALLILALAAWLVLLGGVMSVRWRAQRRADAERRSYRLRFPRDLDAAGVLAFCRSLSALRSGNRRPLAAHAAVVFEARASVSGVEHWLLLPAGRHDEVLRQLRVALPELVIEAMPRPVPQLHLARSLELADEQYPLRTDQAEAAAAALLASLSGTRSGESIVVQWIVSGGDQLPAPAPASSKPSTPWPRLRLTTGAPPTSSEQREKRAEAMLVATLRIGVASEVPARRWVLLREQLGVLHAVERPGVHFRRQWTPNTLVTRDLARARTPLSRFAMHLNARELATLVAWPIGHPMVAGLSLLRTRRLAAPAALPTTGRVIGHVPGSDRAVALSAADGLHHCLYLGPTGVGKSTTIINSALQDIEAGRAVIVIDPKGDAVAELADRIPEKRIDDVIYFDAADSAPAAVNVLEGADRDPDRVADEVVGIFVRRYGAALGPRSSHILRMSVMTLVRTPGMTLVELPALLTIDAFRRELMTAVADDVALGPAWAAFEAYSPAERATVCAPLLNKVGALTLDRRIRACLGVAEPGWSVEQVLGGERKILLVSLAKGDLGGEAAAIIGSLIVSMIWRAARRRAVRMPASVYIDEASDFLGYDTDLADVLAQARGFGIGVTLANQHLGQYSPSLRASVLANARTKLIYQAAADDAALLARQLGGGLTTTDLMNLPAHEAYLAACVRGEVLPPTSVTTPPLPPSRGTRAAVLATSRARYGHPREVTEAEILARQRGTAGPLGPVGKRRRAS